MSDLKFDKAMISNSYDAPVRQSASSWASSSLTTAGCIAVELASLIRYYEADDRNKLIFLRTVAYNLDSYVKVETAKPRLG
jgi:hypothetical protein